MIHKVQVMIIGCLLSSYLLAHSPTANTVDENIDDLPHHWSVAASLGYGDYQNMYQNDGETALGRLAIATELFVANQGTVGLEAGVQNGNHMQVATAPDPFNVLNRFVVQTTVRPMLDFLLTANTDLIGASLFFAQVKGGIAYRQWKIASNLINSKSELAGEIQAGLGCPLTEITSLNLLYQGVFGANSKFSFSPFTNTGVVASIPVQHGLLLGLSVTS